MGDAIDRCIRFSGLAAQLRIFIDISIIIFRYFSLVVSLKARTKEDGSKPLTVVAHASERIIVRVSIEFNKCITKCTMSVG